MSGASATVSAASPVSAPAAAPPAPETDGEPGPVQSFTEVLSAQRAESRNGEGDRRNADGERGPAHGAKDVQANGRRPSAPSSGQPSAPGSPVAPICEVADAVPVAAVSAPAASTPATDGDATVPEAAIDGGSLPPVQPSVGAAPTSASAVASDATMTTSSTISTESVASDAAPDVRAAVAAAVPDAESGGSGNDEAGRAGSTATAATTSAGNALATRVAPKPVLPAPPVAVPVHGGATTAPTAHAVPPPTEAANVPGSTPAAPPVPHLMNESALAPSDATRAAASVARAGESAAPSAASVAQQGASALDVDALSGTISRPLSDGNGTYTVTVALHPPELGHLQAVMSLDGNDLQVSLAAQTQTGHDALANATNALKDQLARGGVNVNVTLRDPGSQTGGEERYRPPTTSGAGAFAAGSAATETPLPSGLVTGQIHLVL
jgi:Flagellar hook-length control protein FliK